MENPTQQIVERLKQASNILVTVSANPSVDQLAAAIGFTLLLNKMDKHASAVFSGQVPSVLEFLQPEETLEKTTDSLRDFIIALDKSKADKLRYKVEEDHVKIFITPYRTSISEKDLEFSQGDFNVEVVVALGVRDPNDLDQAITSHGRILHDATVISVSTAPGGTLGSINWAELAASSLSEMLVTLAGQLGPNLLDEQMATAFLTGIVAETDRFSNAKTSAITMSTSSRLMAAGANQQLVATKLETTKPAPPAETPDKQLVEEAEKPAAPSEPETKPAESAKADGSLEVHHDDEDDAELSEESDEPAEIPLDQIRIDDQGTLRKAEEVIDDEPSENQDSGKAPKTGGSKLVLDPPTLGGTLTANDHTQGLEPTTDPLSATAADKPLLSHDQSADNSIMPLAAVPDDTSAASAAPADDQPAPMTSPEPALELPQPMLDSDTPLVAAPPAETEQVEQSLADLEQTVQQSEAMPPADVSDAREAVEGALASSAPPPEPIAALNAHPIDLDLGRSDQPPPPPLAVEPQVVSGVDPVAPPPFDSTLSPNLVPSEPTTPSDPTGTSVINPTAPPPVPPPMMPPLPGLDEVQLPSSDQQTPQAF